MSQFANYSNTTQQLRDSVSQLDPTTSQITDDKANFEQQFLIGASLMAKAKATEQGVKILKNSKFLKSVKGKGEAEVKKLVESGQDRAKELAERLRQKIPGVNQKTPEPEINPSASPENLDQLKDIADSTAERASNTAQALEDANNDMVDTRDALRVANNTRDTAEQIVENNTRRAVSQAGGRIKLSEQVSDSADRAALNDARSGVDAAESQAAAAESRRNALADELVQHQSDADRAATDLQSARGATEDVESSVESVAKVGGAIEKTEEAEKGLKIAKDVEEGSEAAGEADPFAFIVTGLAAIATNIIGRRVKAHESVLSSAPPPPTTYSATIGAAV